MLPKYKTVIFVHGCFWHRHAKCKIATTPKSNTQFWIEKFQNNVLRDARVTALLESSGWHVLVAWECQLSNASRALATAKDMAMAIKDDDAD